MVGNDDVHAGRGSPLDGIKRRDSTVDRDDHPGTQRDGAVHPREREIVAVPGPVGHDCLGPPAQCTYPAGEQRGSRDAVGVVVAVDHHQLPAFHRQGQPACRPVRVQEQGGIVQVFQARTQEGLRGVGCRAAPDGQQATQGPGKLQVPFEGADDPWFRPSAKGPSGTWTRRDHPGLGSPGAHPRWGRTRRPVRPPATRSRSRPRRQRPGP